MDPIQRLNDALTGQYTVEKEVGAGGMATVYLAEDTKHHRKVAIKVLRDEVAESVGAARFLREIEIAAQLQHPNILPLLDSGEANGMLYYVMPFVEGKSLRQRLARDHELPVGEAVRLIMEIVDALSAAHARGIVHRDIKPDNVMLSGRHALVTDFGVARAVSQATSTSQLTSMGIALGTPSYMSPEQASADPSMDHRADLYSVGVMAYELLAGTLPFVRATPQQVLAAHVSQQPEPITVHRPGLSPALASVVMRCLEKRPADRWQSADELLHALEPLSTPSAGLTPVEGRTTPVMPADSVRTAAIRKRRRMTYAALGGVALAALGTWAATRERTRIPELVIGKSVVLTSEDGMQVHPALSPDGKLLAYASGNTLRMRIYIRAVSGGRVIALSDDSTAREQFPRWSPDGSELLFLTRGGVSVSPALGGSSRQVVAHSHRDGVTCATWAPDGKRIAFVRGDSLLITTLGSEATTFVAKQVESYSCAWSPTGEWIAFASDNATYLVVGPNFGNTAPSRLWLVSPTSGAAPVQVTTKGSMHESPEWSRDGRSLYFVSDIDGVRDLYGVGVGSSGVAKGDPVRLTTGLGPQSASLSGDGSRVAYTVYTARSNIWTIDIPQQGVADASTARQVTNGSQVIESANLSNDGKWLLYDSDLGGMSNVWRMPIGGGAAQQLTHVSAFPVFAPSLSADGTLLAYHSWRRGQRDIEVMPVDGGPVEYPKPDGGSESYPVWSPTGHRLQFYDQQNAGNVYVTERRANGSWSPADTVIAMHTNFRPMWTPDGRQLLVLVGDSSYAFVDVATHAVRVVPFAFNRESAESALLSPDGHSIYMKRHDENGQASFWSIPATGGTARLLVRFTDPTHQSSRSDFTSDGKRFFYPVAERQSSIWVAEVGKK
ncbi:MAG: protein kinase [Gemmatimonadetes bacterium]|nr:protein kinase [Gemmatimonadota bacterium]